MATFIAVAFAVTACIIVLTIAEAVAYSLMNTEREDLEPNFILIAIPLLMAVLFALISFAIVNTHGTQ